MTRQNMFLVTLDWLMPDKTHFRRKIAELGINAQSAKNKVLNKYQSPEMVSKLGKVEFIAITNYYSE